MKRVYIEQFDSWWSTDLDTWIKFLKDNITGKIEVWDLNELFNPLKKIPYHAVISTTMSERKSYMVKSAYDLYARMPCDWELETYQLALQEARKVQKKIKENNWC